MPSKERNGLGVLDENSPQSRVTYDKGGSASRGKDAGDFSDYRLHISYVALENATVALGEPPSPGHSLDDLVEFVPGVRVKANLATDIRSSELAKRPDRVSHPHKAELVSSYIVDRIKIRWRRYDEIDGLRRERKFSGVGNPDIGLTLGLHVVLEGSCGKHSFDRAHEFIKRVDVGPVPHAVRSAVREIHRKGGARLLGDYHS